MSKQTKTVTVRPSLLGIPLGNRFAGLPTITQDDEKRGDVMTLKEVAKAISRSKQTATKRVKDAGLKAVCLVVTGSSGRPSPCYDREEVEQFLDCVSFGSVDSAKSVEADSLLGAIHTQAAGSVD